MLSFQPCWRMDGLWMEQRTGCGWTAVICCCVGCLRVAKNLYCIFYLFWWAWCACVDDDLSPFLPFSLIILYFNTLHIVMRTPFISIDASPQRNEGGTKMNNTMAIEVCAICPLCVTTLSWGFIFDP